MTNKFSLISDYSTNERKKKKKTSKKKKQKKKDINHGILL